jgi:hypothetical protein
MKTSKIKNIPPRRRGAREERQKTEKDWGFKFLLRDLRAFAVNGFGFD